MITSITTKAFVEDADIRKLSITKLNDGTQAVCHRDHLDIVQIWDKVVHAGHPVWTHIKDITVSEFKGVVEHQTHDHMHMTRLSLEKLTGMFAAVNISEPIEGFVERPQDLIGCVKELASMIKTQPQG